MPISENNPETVYLMSLQALKERLIEREHAVDKMFAEVEKRYGQVSFEMDKRYQQRFEAQETALNSALKAQHTLFEAVTAASKEAISKAEAAQKDKNEMTNEFRGQLADQAVTFMPRKEVEQIMSGSRLIFDNFKSDCFVQREELLRSIAKKFDEVGHEIRTLRESRSHLVGREERGKDDTTAWKWVITTILAIGAFIMAVLRYGR